MKVGEGKEFKGGSNGGEEREGKESRRRNDARVEIWISGQDACVYAKKAKDETGKIEDEGVKVLRRHV